jgi:hypothetical protein
MRRVLLGVLAAVAALVVALVASTGWLDALGAAPSGERLARIRRSPNFRDGAFRNPDATSLTSAAASGTTSGGGWAATSSACPPGRCRSCV